MITSVILAEDHAFLTVNIGHFERFIMVYYLFCCLIFVILTDSALHCWARSYDCVFNCKWKNDKYSAVRVGLGEDW